MSKKPKSTTLVIFGASGDLTRRKLVPALFSLYRKERLPADCNIIGFAWTKWDTAEFRQRMRNGIDEFTQEAFSEADWAAFVNRLHYVSGSFSEPEDYALLQETLNDLEGESADRLYYLAT
jgi:glucose-6-phosphate 1-dehydrogenase